MQLEMDMNGHDGYRGSSDEIDSDTETLLYSKIHYNWDDNDELVEKLGEVIPPKRCKTMQREKYGLKKSKTMKNSKELKRKKIIKEIQPETRTAQFEDHNVENIIVLSDSDDYQLSKYNQKFNVAKPNIVQQCIEVDDLSSDSDCIVLSVDKCANVIQDNEENFDLALNIIDDSEDKSHRNVRKPASCRKKKGIRNEIVENGRTNHDAPLVNTTDSSNATLAKYNNEMTYLEKMQKFYDSDCSLLDDHQLKLLTGSSVRKKKARVQRARNVPGRYFGSKQSIRCDNCKQWDHAVKNCPFSRKRLICYLCSDDGHSSANCPSTCCSICFQHGHNSFRCHNAAYRYKMMCKLCKCIGHNRKDCPDLWRRYYLTTKPGPLVKGNPADHRKVNEVYCCNCGQRGHYVFDCRRNKMKPGYHPIWPFVIKYKDVNRHSKRVNKKKKSRKGNRETFADHGHGGLDNGNLRKEAKFLRRKNRSYRHNSKVSRKKNVQKC